MNVSFDNAGAKISHAELNNFFCDLDVDQEMLAIEFDGWLVWPIVKSALWHWLILPDMNTTASDKRHQAREILHALASAARGGRDCIRLLRCVKPTQVAILYSQRESYNTPARLGHPYLGQVMEKSPNFFGLVYGWGRFHGRHNSSANAFLFEDCRSFLSLASRLLRHQSDIRKISEEIATLVSHRIGEQYKDGINHICRSTLAYFKVASRFFDMVFKVLNPGHILVMDPDAKCAEIAAAKRQGICVVEIQHGMFGRKDPDYSWRSQHRDYFSKLTVPDRVFVFGPVWRDALMSNGFWDSADVVCVGNASLLHLAQSKSAQPAPTAIIKVLFPSQYYVATEAIAFLTEMLEIVQADELDYLQLRIAVHPMEKHFAARYLALARKFSPFCVVEKMEDDGFDTMLRADVIMGYTSFMMIEALGAGKQAVSICQSPVEGGISEVFDMPMLEECIPHIRSPQEAVSVITEMWARKKEQVPSDTINASDIFFFPDNGFEKTLVEKLLNDAWED